jgi:hypothetical protein
MAAVKPLVVALPANLLLLVFLFSVIEFLILAQL